MQFVVEVGKAVEVVLLGVVDDDVGLLIGLGVLVEDSVILVDAVELEVTEEEGLEEEPDGILTVLVKLVAVAGGDEVIEEEVLCVGFGGAIYLGRTQASSTTGWVVLAYPKLCPNTVATMYVRLDAA